MIGDGESAYGETGADTSLSADAQPNSSREVPTEGLLDGSLQNHKYFMNEKGDHMWIRDIPYSPFTTSWSP